MRLKNVERGDTFAHRALFQVIRFASGYRAPDVIRTLQYRRPFFGEPHAEHTHEVMRGPSAWSIADRELFAAFVSRLNRCRF